MQYRLDTKKPHLLCLILLIGFPSVAAVLISPALPAMRHFFNVSNGYTQQLITIFVVGYALGQLIYSPVANRFGRKIATYLGMSLYLLSCLVCLAGIYLHQIEIVFFGRFLMALGSSVGMVISFTIINDFYYPEQARPIVSYSILSYAFMPALAIALGGLITTHFHWIYCFYFYFIYGIVVLVISTRLPETLQQKNPRALNLKPLLHSFYHAFSAWRLVLFSIIFGLMSAFVYIIASGGPFIGIDEIGLTPANYGMLLLIPYCGQFIGALSAGRLSKQLSAYQVMGLGYSSIIVGSLFMFICFACHWVNAFSLMAPIFFIMMGLPMTYSSASVMALVDYEDKATGSAIMGFITLSITLAAIFILTLLPSKVPLMMPSLFIVILIMAVTAYFYAKNRFKESNDART